MQTIKSIDWYLIGAFAALFCSIGVVVAIVIADHRRDRILPPPDPRTSRAYRRWIDGR